MLNPNHRGGDLASLEAGQRVRSRFPVAGGDSRRPNPRRLARRLRRSLLEPPGTPCLLPLLYGRPHRAPPRPTRPHLPRHAPRRLRRRPRPELPRVPPRRLLRLAPGPGRRGQKLG